MTPAEVGEAFAAFGVAEVSFGQCTVTVEPARWVAAATFARDSAGFGFFDFLTAVDELEAGYAVVLHLYSPAGRAHLLLRTLVPTDAGRLPSLVPVFAGADWHERETAEMFGLVFDGHPNPLPLLLPDGFDGHPLRKDFVLAARAVKAWPGAKEPGESHAGAAPSRRPNLPPGVPAPGGAWPRPVPVETARPDPPAGEPEPPVPAGAGADDGPAADEGPAPPAADLGPAPPAADLGPAPPAVP